MSFTEEEKQRLLEDVCAVRHILTGNGNPEKGVVFRVQTLEQFVGGVKRAWWIVIGAMVGVPATVIAAVLVLKIK